MKTQHTPGPWDTEPKGSRHFVDGADGLTVAYLDRAGVRERAEIEANACLITSAPDLLAALTNILARVEASPTLLPHISADVRNEARAAIARATIAKATGV